MTKVLQLEIFRDSITGLQLNGVGAQHDTVVVEMGLLYCINLFINLQKILKVLNFGLVLKGQHSI